MKKSVGIHFLLAITLYYICAWHVDAKNKLHHKRRSPANPTLENVKGDLLQCSIDYLDQPLALPRTAIIRPSLPHTYLTSKDYEECFSGGRSSHRDNMVSASATQRRSEDWRVKVSLKKSPTGQSVDVVVNNRRREPVRVWFNSNETNVNFSPLNSLIKVVDRRTKATLVTATVPNITFPLEFAWSWRAEPLHYEQLECNQQLYSNGVFLIVENRKHTSTFWLHNQRNEIDAPVHLRLNIKPRGDTARDNLVLSQPSPLEVQVYPGKKQKILQVSVKDINRPWGFYYSYRWQSGLSPKYVFGVAPGQVRR